MATMKTDPQEALVLQGLEAARRLVEQTGGCPSVLVPIRDGAARFDRQRVLGPNDFARVASELGARSVLLLGAKVLPEEGEFYVNCQLADCWGATLLYGRQRLMNVDDTNTGTWSEPKFDDGPFPTRDESWIPQE